MRLITRCPHRPERLVLNNLSIPLIPLETGQRTQNLLSSSLSPEHNSFHHNDTWLWRHPHHKVAPPKRHPSYSTQPTQKRTPLVIDDNHLAGKAPPKYLRLFPKQANP
jgi:hypothetical protein